MTSMLIMSPSTSFRESGMPWHTHSLTEVHTLFGKFPAQQIYFHQSFVFTGHVWSMSPDASSQAAAGLLSEPKKLQISSPYVRGDGYAPLSMIILCTALSISSVVTPACNDYAMSNDGIQFCLLQTLCKPKSKKMEDKHTFTNVPAYSRTSAASLQEALIFSIPCTHTYAQGEVITSSL